MSPLDRILIMRADEQANSVSLDKDGPRDVYTARCRHPGCMRLVVYWNKTQRCTPHGNLFRKNERNRLRRSA